MSGLIGVSDIQTKNLIKVVRVTEVIRAEFNKLTAITYSINISIRLLTHNLYFQLPNITSNN